MKRKLFPRSSWDDVKRVLELKTFYVIAMLTLVGIVLIMLDAYVVPSTWPIKGSLSTLGMVLVTSCTVSLIYEIFLRLDVEEFLGAKLLEYLQGQGKGIGRFQQLGFNSVVESRANLSFHTMVTEARSFTKIMGLTVPDITDDSCRAICLRRLRTERDFYIQILLLNPCSVICLKRAKARVYRSPDVYYKKIASTIRDLWHLRGCLEEEGIGLDRFDVRLYDAIPSCSLIITGDIAYITTYVVYSLGSISPCLEVLDNGTENSLYSLFLRHFDYVWQNSPSLFSGPPDEIYKATLELDRKELEHVAKLADGVL